MPVCGRKEMPEHVRQSASLLIILIFEMACNYSSLIMTGR